MKVSVLFIIPRIGKGGAERVVVNIANQMSADGYPVSILTIMSEEENYHLSEGVVHTHVGIQGKNKLLRMIRRFFRIRKLVKQSGADTVVAFDRYYGILGSLYTGKRVIGSERNDPYSNMPSRSFQKYIRDFLYRKVDFMVFQTEYARNYFSEKIKSHSCIIPNPVSVDFLPEPYNGLREKEVVAACRLTEQKNLPMLLDAFARFSNEHPDYKLVIYGEGPLLVDMKTYAASKGIAERVMFAGYVNDLPYRMVQAAMYVSSSNYEGISNSMLEAMALGMPVVCTDCPAGGAAMVIEDQVNGYLIPVKDAIKMAEAMCNVIEQPAKAQRMAAEAVKVRDTYSIRRVAKMWEEVL